MNAMSKVYKKDTAIERLHLILYLNLSKRLRGFGLNGQPHRNFCQANFHLTLQIKNRDER